MMGKMVPIDGNPATAQIALVHCLFHLREVKTSRRSIHIIEGGMGIAFGMLAAVDQGLGTCLNTCITEEARKALKLPKTATVLWIMSVGYPEESPELERQRPRRPFEELFSFNNYKTPFKRSRKVINELKKSRMMRP